MNLLFNFIVCFSFCVFSAAASTATAVTLKQMAHTSNFILVIADRFGASQKASKQTCGLDQAQISELSQKLRMEVDAKIMSLNDKDYALINERIQTCEDDCSCDIYALALEKKNIKSADLDSKASQITGEQREACAKVNKHNCNSPFFKKLVKQK